MSSYHRQVGSKAERTQRRLLDAAEGVFARRGYTTATVDEIADEAGLSIGALYSRLGGKEDVFLAVFDRYLDNRLNEIRLLRSSQHRPDAAASAWIALVDARKDQLLLFIEFWLYAVRQSAPAAARMAQSLREFDEGVEVALAEGLVGESPSSSEAHRIARSIVALYRGAAMSHVLNPGADSASYLATSTRDLVETSADHPSEWAETGRDGPAIPVEE